VQISPRYDGDPVVRLDGMPGAVGVPFLRQRRRFADTLTSLSPEQWTVPSRCDGWRVQDVVAHLTGADLFWYASIRSGLDGTPTRILATFDPKATPAMMVDAVRDASHEDTLASYVQANEALCSVVESLDDNGWRTIAESPAGHVTMTAVAHHALWDSWVHERDVLVPLGLTQAEEVDEIVASLRYAAALGPALSVQSATGRRGALAIVAERPATRVVVTVDGDVRVTEADPPRGALVLTGDAIEVLEALSVRAAWRQPIPDANRWLLAGLTEVFETVTAS
jgi:uncharacterized protein (TIGR03083 family)